MLGKIENRANTFLILRNVAIALALLGVLASCVKYNSDPPIVLEPNDTNGLNSSALCDYSGHNIKVDGYIEYVKTEEYEHPEKTIDCGKNCSMKIPGYTSYTTYFNFYFGKPSGDSVVALRMSGKHGDDFSQFAHVELTGEVRSGFYAGTCYISANRALVFPFNEKSLPTEEP